MEIRDIENARTRRFHGTNPLMPHSVFITGDDGYAIEFDRAEFLEAIRREFNLVPAAMLGLDFGWVADLDFEPV